MSFRLADLKKSVRKSKEGLQVTAARLEGRSAAFKIEFLLDRFGEHLGRSRRALEPEGEVLSWGGQARSLALRRGEVAKLLSLDRAEEAVLVRIGPRPTPADVCAVYNARAHSTLLRSARWIEIACAAARPALEQAA